MHNARDFHQIEQRLIVIRGQIQRAERKAWLSPEEQAALHRWYDERDALQAKLRGSTITRDIAP